MVLESMGAAEVPVIDPVTSSKAVFLLEGLSRFDGVLPLSNGLIYIIGMDKLRPAQIPNLLKAQAGKLSPLGVDVIDSAIR